MARTKGKTTADSIVRAIEYNGEHVAKTASGKIFAVFNYEEENETKTLADDIADAKSIIDAAKQKSRVSDDPRKRGRRTKGVKVKQFDPEVYKHLSHGGYRQNPPADCLHKCHWEGEPEQLFWVNNITCHGTCKKSEQCDHFKEFMKGGKRRIKLMNTERMDNECQFCKAQIESIDEEGSGVYKCGTSYNRLEGEYTRVCKPPKKEKKQEEKTKRGRRKK